MPDSDLDTLLGKLAATMHQRVPLKFVGVKRFELLRQIGRGAFGEVYEARDREHGTRVALKALRSSHPDWIYRFKREFRIVGDLAHPNLVRLYELFVEDDRWYLTMELIDGLRLDEHLRRAPDQLRSCFAQLALGIAELHRARCLHRDLKPSNALVESTGRLVLLDFGLAVHQRASGASAIAGTPPYMAPELGLGQRPSAASDWYAFGVMLYEALAGVLPFQGQGPEMLERKLGRRPPLPSELRQGVDERLERLAMDLLDKDPAARPDTAAVLAELGSDDRVLAATRYEHGTGTPIVGRDRELATLEAALASSSTSPAVVTVRGAPGMGKTSMVTAFFERQREPRAQVYQGRCLELESVPHKGLDGAIDALANDLARRRYDEVTRLVPRDVDALAQMFPMLKRIEAFSRALATERRPRRPQELRQAASRALRELLTSLTAAAPVAIFIDDLQWCGDDTVRLLLDLLGPPAPSLLLVVAYRHDHGAPAPVLERFLAGLVGTGLVPTEIDIAPLDRAAVDTWLAAISEQRVSTDLALHETAGHPYLLSRWLHHGAPHGEHPRELSAVLSAELDQLDAKARRILDFVSIAGGPIRAQAVFEAGELSRDPSTLDQLRRLKLVHGSSGNVHIETYHDRVRETALEAMSPAYRRDLHLRLAGALERTGVADPEALARHYRDGGNPERALHWTRRAAENATRSLAFARAAELYAQASELDIAPSLRLEVLGELAEAQARYGRQSDAAETCLMAAELALSLDRPTAREQLRSRAGEHLLLAGQLERGLALIRDALAAVDVQFPASAAVAVAESFNIGGALATRGLDYTQRDPATVAPSLVERTDLELAVARALTLTDIRGPMMAARGLMNALTVGEPRRVQRALAYFVINHVTRMPGDSLVTDAEARAHALAEQLVDEVGTAWAELASGLHAVYRCEYALALSAFSRAEKRFLAAPGHDREATLTRLAFVMVCGNYCIDIPSAVRGHAGVTEAALDRGDVFSATWSTFVRIMLDLALGNPRAARAHLAAVKAAWPNMADSLFSSGFLLNSIAVALYEDPAGAWNELDRIEPEFHRQFSSMLPFSVEVYTRLAAHAAIGALAAGRADRATTLKRIAPLVERLEGHPARTAGSFQVTAQYHLAAGDLARSIEAREQAVAAWHATQQFAFAQSARLRLAQLREDEAGRRAATEEMIRLGVGDPERFANVFAGPLL